MKKLIFMMIAMFTLAIGANAQETQMNYAGSSKFTDNWSVTVQGGIATKYSNAFKKIAPTITVGADKYVTPWLGFGVEGRTLINASGVKYGSNPHTMFDAVNVNGYGKLNLVNLFDYDGNKKVFEPVLYTGLGWGHMNCSEMTTPRNYMTYRAGLELNLNVGKNQAWGVVLNPSIVWGDIDNFKLNSRHAYVEFNAGLVYHFRTSNGCRSMKKALLYDAAAMKALADEVAQLKTRKPERTVPRKQEVKTQTVTVYINPDAYFAQGESVIDPTSESVLDKIAEDIKSNSNIYVVTGYASVEGDEDFNKTLSQKRADAVKDALVKRGVSADRITSIGAGETEKFGSSYEANRRVTVEKK